MATKRRRFTAIAGTQAGLEEVFAGATSRRQKDHEATIHDLHLELSRAK